MAYRRRLMKEIEGLKNNPPKGIILKTSDNLEECSIDLEVLSDNPLYIDQIFELNFKFPSSYPLESPQVQFIRKLDRPIPIHPHIYSNGHICLDLLGSGWSPIQTISSICLSLQSMLTDNTRAHRPPDNDDYVLMAPINPKHTKFLYHDDSI